MRVLMLGGLLAALCLTLIAAGGEEAPDPDEARIEALLQSGEIARAEELASALVDRDQVGTGAQADRLERLAGWFYGTSTPQGVSAAQRLFARALRIRESLADRDPAALASLVHDLSGVAFNDGDYALAEEHERRAVEILERIAPPGDTRLAKSRRDLAFIFMAQGRLQDAVTLLPEALKVIEDTATESWEQVAAGRDYLAELYRLQGRYADAASLLEALVEEAPQKLGADSPQFPWFLNNLAGVYRDQGRLDEAETLLRRSLVLRKEASPRDDGAVARATLNLAELYRAQGNFTGAEPLYREALELARASLGAGSSEMFEFINQMAVLLRDQGRLDEAEPRFREALELVEHELGPEHMRVAQSCLDLAELLRMRGACQAAAPYYSRAAGSREKALGSGHPDLAEALTGSARCLASDPARRDDARAAVDRAIAILGESEAHPEVAVDALALRAELRQRQDPPGGLQDLAEALRRVESMRPHRGGGEGTRAEFFGRYAGLYERMVRAEVEAQHPARALAAAERGRARALLDQLAAAHVGDAARQDPVIERRLAAARASLAEIRERMNFERSRTDRLAAERPRRLADLERRLEEATRSFRELYDEARNASAAWRGAVAGEPATVAQIQADVVPKEGLLLLYEVGREGSFVFVVPPAPGNVEARKLTIEQSDAVDLGVAAGPLTEATLDAVVLGSRGTAPGLLAQLAPPGEARLRGIGGLSVPGDFEGRRLHALWRVLIPSDLRSRLEGATEALVVPDAALFLLPFEALVVKPGADLKTTRFWLDAGPPVRYAPSATFVHRLAARAAPPTRDRARASALSVSDPAYGGPAGVSSGTPAVRRAYLGGGGTLPRLPGTAAESRAIRSALEHAADVVVLDGAAARESAVRRELAGKRYVHIATHGLVDQEQAEIFAALALAPPPGGSTAGDDDGLLQLFEIYDLRLDCELAVLSACSTNTGRVVAGEGIFALSRGFLVSGARRVIASQWPVDDASTAELVGALFREVAAAQEHGGRLDAARALREAKLSVRRGKAAWAHPFFWAPFVLMGVE